MVIMIGAVSGSRFGFAWFFACACAYDDDTRRDGLVLRVGTLCLVGLGNEYPWKW